MRAHDLKGKNIVIWGTGREGRAAAAFLRRVDSNMSITFVDEAKEQKSLEHETVLRNPGCIADALYSADAVIKSPGVSLYHPLIKKLKDKGVLVTSLMNLWLAEPHKANIIGITGTKGKSTTAALLSHTLNTLGIKTALGGNIGLPVSEITVEETEFAIIEISSYQAADIEGTLAAGILVSLYPEHLDWHQILEAYYRDKLNLLHHSHLKIINADALEILHEHKLMFSDALLFNHPSGFHVKNRNVYQENKLIGSLTNSYLSRSYNLSNVCAVLSVLRSFGFDPVKALSAMESFKGLPHRQQELGKKDGIFYVDDSISTTPQSAIAALESYSGKPVTLIAGGYDRGIDYEPLVNYLITEKANAVVCMGASGEKLFSSLKSGGYKNVFFANSMKEAIALAKQNTPEGGVILLSPAAPSYGMFRNFEERGNVFAAESDFNPAFPDNV